MMPSKAEDYEVMLTIGCGSYGKCQKIRRKSDGKVNKIQIELRLHEQYGIDVMYFYIRSLNQNQKLFRYLSNTFFNFILDNKISVYIT